MGLSCAVTPTSSACPGRAASPRVRRRSPCAEGATTRRAGWPRVTGAALLAWPSPPATAAGTGTLRRESTSTFGATIARWAGFCFAFGLVTSSGFEPILPGFQFLRLAAEGDFSNVKSVSLSCVCVPVGDTVPGGLCHLSSVPGPPLPAVGGLPPVRDTRAAFWPGVRLDETILTCLSRSEPLWSPVSMAKSHCPSVRRGVQAMEVVLSWPCTVHICMLCDGVTPSLYSCSGR